MNSLGSNKETVENKLILLYIIDRLNIPVSNLQITRLVLEKRFMNYFLLQQHLNELQEGRLLSVERADDKALYMITDAGRKTLEYFTHLIPSGLKARMDSTFAAMRKEIRSESLVTADYTPESENKFTAACKVSEDGFSLLQLDVTVGTKSDARLICENWKKHSQLIYAEIIDALTKKRD
jgi:predicted transcriptional regulator